VPIMVPILATKQSRYRACPANHLNLHRPPLGCHTLLLGF
jgi:hypothetical protein